MRTSSFFRFVAFPAIVAAVLVVTADAQEKAKHSAVTPMPRSGKSWESRHAKFNEAAKKGDIDLVFIGDSITQGWEGAGKEAWQKYYGHRKPLNLGIGGDRTQHVLWRLENGNIDGIKPKLAIVMIGTNNSNGQDNTAEEIGEGIQAIVKKLRSDLPETKVLILAVFPRGEKPNSQREKNAAASKIASELADDKMVFFMDIGKEFLEDDGTLPKEIMPDYLHLSPKGYEIWASAIEPKVAELLGEKKS